MEQTAVELPRLLARLIGRQNLTEDEAAGLMGAIMRGELESPQIAALLVALRAKGESASEIAGFVRALVGAATPVEIEPGLAARLVDVVGTGGDAAGTFNISTVASVVVAAAGQPVAKHGNRAASSRCGSADLLEAWGIPIELGAVSVARCLEEVGITFLFARTFHPAMRVVAPVRQQLGVPTTFNVLGPLSNPARVPHLAVGVADENLAPVMAEALGRLGRRALVFRGVDGLDELTTSGQSRAWEVRDGEVSERVIDPTGLGIPRASREAISGGDAAENAAIADAVLAGEPGARSDIVALNAAAALYVSGAVEDLASGVDRARTVLTSGAALDLKHRWVECAQRLAANESSEAGVRGGTDG